MVNKKRKIYGNLPQLSIGVQLAINHGSICRIGMDGKGYYLERIGNCKKKYLSNEFDKKDVDTNR